MKLDKIFKASVFLPFLCGIFCNMSWAANNFPTSPQANNTQSYGIAFIVGIIIVLVISGLYRSKKERIVVFANLTDVLVTLCIPIGIVVIGFLGMIMRMREDTVLNVALLFGVCGVVIVANATKAYNKSIAAGFFGFLHALFTKLAIVSPGRQA